MNWKKRNYCYSFEEHEESTRRKDDWAKREDSIEGRVWPQRKRNARRGSDASRFTIWRPCPGISDAAVRRDSVEKHWIPSGPTMRRGRLTAARAPPHQKARLAPGSHEHATGVPVEKLFLRPYERCNYSGHVVAPWRIADTPVANISRHRINDLPSCFMI